jgi:hypothetical protein
LFHPEGNIDTVLTGALLREVLKSEKIPVYRNFRERMEHQKIAHSPEEQVPLSKEKIIVQKGEKSEKRGLWVFHVT